MLTACQSRDRLEVIFDDELSAANAGLVLPATLAARLDLQVAANELISRAVPGSFRPARKAMTLVHSMIAGGDCIDDVDVLGAGETEGTRPSSDGHFDVRDVPAGLHLRACPPARHVVRVRVDRGVDGWRGTGR